MDPPRRNICNPSSLAFVQGKYRYTSADWYVGDTWKVSRNFTLLYGARISFMGPQHDVSGVANTFLPSAFVGSQAPRLFTPAVVNGKSVVVNPITQEVVPNSYATLIVTGSGNLTDGILFPGKGVPDTILISQGELFQPRLGVSWDVTGKGTTGLRAGAGTALAEFAKVSQTPGAKVEDSELSNLVQRTDRSPDRSGRDPGAPQVGKSSMAFHVP